MVDTDTNSSSHYNYDIQMKTFTTEILLILSQSYCTFLFQMIDIPKK